MSSIKSRYSLCQVDNNKFCQIQVSGRVNNGEPGYIWVPYVMSQSSTVIVDGMDWVRYKRNLEIQKRREKIEHIRRKYESARNNGIL